MGPVAAGVQAATGVASAIGGKNAQKAANAQAQQAAEAQQKVQQQLLNNIQQQQTEYNQQYAPQLGNLSKGLGQEASAANGMSGQLSHMLLQAGMDPSVISQITGIDAKQLTQNAVNYESNPGATQTGQVGGNVVNQLGNVGGTNLAQQTPGILQAYQQEAQHGLNPQFAQNAQNQIQQTLNQEEAQTRASQHPGQNIQGTIQNLQNQALSQSANLAGNLAGQSQQFQNIGLQGLQGAAQGLDSQKSSQLIQQLQAAGVIDQQTMQMLQGAATGGNNFNQQQLGNLQSSNTAANDIYGALNNFVQSGQHNVQAGYGPLAGVGQQFGAQSTAAAQNAANAGQQVGAGYGSAASGLANLFPMGQRSAPQTSSLPSPSPLGASSQMTIPTSGGLFGNQTLSSPGGAISPSSPLGVSTQMSGGPQGNRGLA